MAMTAVVALTERGVLRPPGPAPAGGALPPIPVNLAVEARCAHPAEVAVMGACDGGQLRFTAACQAMRPLAEQFRRRLVAAGLAGDATTLPLSRARALFGLALLLTVECERLFHAFGTHHRVGLLGLLIGLDVILALVLARRGRVATARSEQALKPLRLAAGRYKDRSAPPVGQALAFGVALIGASTLARDPRFDGLGRQVDAGSAALLAPRRAAQDDSGWSSGSSCSAGSCSSNDGDGGGGSCSSSACGSGCGGGGD